MRTCALIALVIPLLAAGPPTTRTAQWVLQARIVEAPSVPTTQPAGLLETPRETFARTSLRLLAPGAKTLTSMEVLAVDREPFSASTTIGDRRIGLSGRARSMKGPTPRVMVEFEFADVTGVTSISGTSFSSNILVTIDEPFVTGLCEAAAGRGDFGLVVTLKPRKD
jgi:hypothetical protein